MRIVIFIFVIALSACSREQSQSIGQQPKKTVDRVATDVNKAMQQGQGSERLREDDAK